MGTRVEKSSSSIQRTLCILTKYLNVQFQVYILTHIEVLCFSIMPVGTLVTEPGVELVILDLVSVVQTD